MPIIAVGTPSDETGIDLGYVARSHGKSAVNCRTLAPAASWWSGRCRADDDGYVVRGQLEAASGMVGGRDFGLAIGPNF